MIKLLSELYQILSCLDAGDEVLDQVSAAIGGKPLPKATLLPYSPPNKQAEELARQWGAAEKGKYNVECEFPSIAEMAVWVFLVINNIAAAAVMLFYTVKIV